MTDALRDALNAQFSAGRERYAKAKDKPGQLDLFGGGERRSSKVQKKVDWDEAKHPRAADGRFGDKAGEKKSKSDPKKKTSGHDTDVATKTDSRAEWTDHEGSLALRIPGSDFVAVAANGQKDAKNFAVYDTTSDSHDPVEYLPAREVHAWLERNAGDVSTESTDEPDVSTEEENDDTSAVDHEDAADEPQEELQDADEPQTDLDDEFDIEQHIKVAADDITKLRQSDVYRLLEWAPAENRQAVADYITENRPDLADEVIDSLDDLSDEPQGNDDAEDSSDDTTDAGDAVAEDSDETGDADAGPDTEEASAEDAGDGDDETAGDAEDDLELPAFAAAAGIKSWEDAKKKGVEPLLKEAGVVTQQAVRDVATRIFAHDAMANELAAMWVWQTVIAGNKERGAREAADSFGDMSADADGNSIDSDTRRMRGIAANAFLARAIPSKAEPESQSDELEDFNDKIGDPDGILTDDDRVPGSLDEAEESAPAEPDSKEQSGLFDPPETRDDAKEATEREFDENYAFARKSSVANAGEDLLDSARHKRNEWRGLEEAEADGTAEALVTRDNLAKADPHDLVSVIDENPDHALTAAAMAMALRKFPAKPGPKSKRTAARRDEEEQKKDRRQFVEAYQYLKEISESIARTESDPKSAALELKDHIKDRIKELRGQDGDGYMAQATATDRYNSTANLLVDMHGIMGAESYDPKKTSVTNQIKDMQSRLAADSDADSTEIGRLIAEGAGVKKAFGVKGDAKKTFNPAQFYETGEATRKGGRDVKAKTGGNANASVALLTEQHGLRGVQFGNSVTDGEREHHALKAAEALADLADMTGLDDDDIALNGTLGLAVGARGHGSALAHYEPVTNVINLTRKNGIGSLAHEWSHFFDHGMGKFMKFGSDGRNSDREWATVQHEGRPLRTLKKSPDTHGARAAYQGLYKAMGKFQKRLAGNLGDLVERKMMSEKTAKYWRSDVETFARSFERHIQDKLENNGRENSYLVAVRKKEGDAASLWPNEEETAEMAPHFEKIFEAFKARKNSKPEKYSMAAMHAAASQTNTSPSDAQKEAGNYQKGRFWHWGYEVVIENPKGSIRSGKNWQVEMPAHYGYLRRTEGNDGDQVDVFIGPDMDSELVFVVNQQTQAGRFDEHKCVLGCHSEKEAKELYLASYSEGWTGLKSITAVTKPQFLDWLDNGDVQKEVYSRGLFDEEKHPRDHGKFSVKAGGQGGLFDDPAPKADKHPVSEIFPNYQPGVSPQFTVGSSGTLIDETGEALRVHHGTDTNGIDQLAPDHGKGTHGEFGIYTTPNQRQAKGYGKNLHSSHVEVTNPLFVENKGEISSKNMTREDIQKLQQLGYDAIIVTKYQDPGTKQKPEPLSKASEVVLFHGGQFRSNSESDPLDGRRAAGLGEEPAPKPGSGVAGQQMGLFHGKEAAGQQKSLFNVVQPISKKTVAAKIQASLLEKIEDDLKASTKPALSGQKDLFSRISAGMNRFLMEQYAKKKSMPGQGSLFGGAGGRSGARQTSLKFEESKHPRASDGRFGSKAGEHTAKREPAKAKPQGEHDAKPVGNIRGGGKRFAGAKTFADIRDRLNKGETLHVATYGGGTQVEVRRSDRSSSHGRRGVIATADFAEPAEQPAEAPAVMHEGSTGLVTDHGTHITKKDTGAEGKVYAALAGVEGVAKGVAENGTVSVPKYKYIVGVDDVKPAARKGMARHAISNIPRMGMALTALSDAGYDYNDQLQFGMTEDRKLDLLDFSNAERDVDALHQNLNHLDIFLYMFGAERHSEIVVSANATLRAMGDKEFRDFADDFDETIKANTLLDQLDGQEPRNVYFALNARTIPGVAQTEHDGNAKLIMSEKPLSEKLLKEYEITPIVHRPAEIERYELAPQPVVRPKKRTEKPKQVAAAQKKKPERQPGDGTPGWQKVGGSHVFVDGNGKITKGCPGLKGEHVADIIDESDDSRDVRETRQAHAKAEGISGKEYTAKDKRRHSTKKAQEQHGNAKDAAKQHGVATHKVLARMPEAHGMHQAENAGVEEAKQRARQMTGMTAGRIAAVENAYRDHSTVPGFEQSARDFASERPDLFDKHGHDTPAQVWEFIREGAQDGNRAHSSETAQQAAELLVSSQKQPVASPESGGDETWDDPEFADDSFDFGQPSTQESLVSAIADGLGDFSDDVPF